MSKASTCSRCIDICPGHAIRVPASKDTPGGVKLTISKGFCVDCGLCTAVCPTAGLTVMEPAMRTLRKRLRRASQVAPQDGHFYITCVETGLAEKDPCVVEIPCLGMLTWEMWVNLMLDFPNLGVYLPGDLCNRCKAKDAEGLIVDAVCRAQDIVGREVSLVETMRELDFTNSAGMVDPKRVEAFSGMGSGLASIMKDITSAPEDEMPSEEMGQTDSRKMRIRLRKEIMAEKGENTPGLKGAEELGGTLTPARWSVIDAIMRFPEVAPNIQLDGIEIAQDACTRCGECAQGVPARSARGRRERLRERARGDLHRLRPVRAGVRRERHPPRQHVRAGAGRKRAVASLQTSSSAAATEPTNCLGRGARTCDGRLAPFSCRAQCPLDRSPRDRTRLVACGPSCERPATQPRPPTAKKVQVRMPREPSESSSKLARNDAAQ